VLQVSGLQKSYGSLAAVKGVSFEVAKGERFGLLGPNGAGKTTTIAMITGTLDPDAGTAKVDGEVMSTTASNAKRKIGYVPQELAIYDDITAIDNLRFFGALYGLAGAESAKAIDRALEIAGLTDRAKEPVKLFSGGMKRRLNIAVALLHDPELLVFDEPTVGVDPQSRNSIFETLLRLASEGKTIIYTTHYMEEVEKLCQRVAVMDHGDLVAIGTMEELHKNLDKKGEVKLELEEAVATIQLPGANNLRIEDRVLTFEVNDLTNDLPGILTAVAAKGLRVTSVRSSVASLEEVFLHLTGRNLRD
jgi:ABC-2 type transport system ATP-binding protein